MLRSLSLAPVGIEVDTWVNYTTVCDSSGASPGYFIFFFLFARLLFAPLNDSLSAAASVCVYEITGDSVSSQRL